MELNEYEIQLIEVRKVLTEYATKLEELIKQDIINKDKVASGKLLASISTKINIDGNVYTVILNSLEYLKYLETGTKPHWPPTDAILQWVKDKRLPTKELYGDRSLPTEKQLAYLVSRKIAEKGTDANNIISDTVEQLNSVYMKRLQEALVLDVYNAIPVIKIEIK